MDYLSHNIGVNLKRIRKARGFSLDMVAEQTGVSKSMLAQIEKKTANPSIGVLGKIISGLRIDFDDLIRMPPAESYLVEIDKLEATKEVEGQYRVWTCIPISENDIFEIYQIEIEAGQEYSTTSHGEKTKEYLMVTKGEVTVCINEKTYLVKEDQVFRFDSDQDHTYRNNTQGTVSFYVVFLEV
ncbi:MAG: XRE family transcriptional regulator [Eubacteriales bacterium]|nr:XRE family transcriptional regulator [Eubacteriales bacterium]